jgi:hypothetical protein
MSTIQPNLNFRNVEDALAPLSAGTETKVCVVSDCDSLVSHFVDVPHPTYLNELGKAVVQMNMVELGGMNGLNS